MDSSRLCLCDLACIKFTANSLPTLALALILENVHKLERKVSKKQHKSSTNDDNHDVILKGARRYKNNKSKQVVTKHRIKRAIRWCS